MPSIRGQALDNTNVPPPNIPGHTEDTIRSIAQLRVEHQDNATSVERALDHMTALLSRSWFLGVLSVIIIGWIGLNLAMAGFGVRPIDPPPFAWLAGVVSLVSLYMVVLILTTQRREDQLAQHREMLILELALLSEQKTAKVIQLLEESRRDNPFIRDRIDRGADAMAQPVDPDSVLDVIKEANVPTST
jgi:uncharacterized membrane protein